MSDFYREPQRETVQELRVRKSIFLAHVRICRNEESARENLKSICEEHRQANHSCWAYRIGAGKISEYFSDGGEPSGTAGRPILGAIQKKGTTNTLIVVARYFGGIKLGVRGLIEAYGKSAAGCLDAAGLRILRMKKKYAILLPYESQHILLHVLDAAEALREDIAGEYAEAVRITCSVPLDNAPDFEKSLSALQGSRRVNSWIVLS